MPFLLQAALHRRQVRKYLGRKETEWLHIRNTTSRNIEEGIQILPSLYKLKFFHFFYIYYHSRNTYPAELKTYRQLSAQSAKAYTSGDVSPIQSEYQRSPNFSHPSPPHPGRLEPPDKLIPTSGHRELTCCRFRGKKNKTASCDFLCSATSPSACDPLLRSSASPRTAPPGRVMRDVRALLFSAICLSSALKIKDEPLFKELAFSPD